MRFSLTFESPKNINWDSEFHTNEQHNEHYNIVHLSPTTNAKTSPILNQGLTRFRFTKF